MQEADKMDDSIQEIDVPDSPRRKTSLYCLDGIQLSSSLAFVPGKTNDLLSASAQIVFSEQATNKDRKQEPSACVDTNSDVVYSSGSADSGWLRRVNRVNLKTGKFAKLGDHNCLCLDARFGLVAVLEYRKLTIYDENQLVPEQADPAKPEQVVDSEVLAPKRVFEDADLSSGQPNNVTIRRCQGRIVVLIPHNGGALDLYELMGDYDLDSSDFVIPPDPVFVRTRALDISANINCTSLDPTEKFLICGIDGGNGPLFIQIDRLDDGTWKCEPIRDETAEAIDAIVAERAKLALFKFDQRAPNIDKIVPEELKNDDGIGFVCNPETVHYNPELNPPKDRLPFDSDDEDDESDTINYRLRMDSLHCSWCPWSTRFCASATDQAMCFLWDWVEKKKVAAWCSIGKVSAGYAWNNTHAVALALFSPVPSVPLFVFAERASYIHLIDLRTFERQIIDLNNQNICGMTFSRDASVLHVGTSEGIFTIPIAVSSSLVDVCINFIVRQKAKWDEYKWDLSNLDPVLEDRIKRLT